MLDKVYLWISTKGIRKYLPSLIRHGLTALAGVLIAAGMPEVADQVSQLGGPLSEIAVAVAIYALAQLWSFKDKAPKAPEVVK